MDLKVVIRLKENMGNFLAVADVTFDNCLAVTGFNIMNSVNGIFVSMPSQKKPNGEYRDICFPVTKEFRADLVGIILDEYEKKVANSNKGNNPNTGLSTPAPEQMLPADDLPF